MEKQVDPADPEPARIADLQNTLYYLSAANAGIRARTWKYLLNYAPKSKEQWPQFLVHRRALYRAYHEDAQRERARHSKALMHIENDVVRTNLFPMSSGKRGCAFLDNPREGRAGTHRSALGRILFVYAVTNSSIGYTQGMNVILSLLYYTFSTCPDPKEREWAEEDSYFCFFNLMAEIGNNFTERMDNDRLAGMYGKLRFVMDVVREEDAELYHNMRRAGLADNSMFHFRWIALLGANEFSIEDTQAIWDKLFADKSRFELLLFFCAAMVVNVRGHLIGGNFEKCMGVLQKYPKRNVEEIFCMAHKMRLDHHRRTKGQKRPKNLVW